MCLLYKKLKPWREWKWMCTSQENISISHSIHYFSCNKLQFTMDKYYLLNKLFNPPIRIFCASKINNLFLKKMDFSFKFVINCSLVLFSTLKIIQIRESRSEFDRPTKIYNPYHSSQILSLKITHPLKWWLLPHFRAEDNEVSYSFMILFWKIFYANQNMTRFLFTKNNRCFSHSNEFTKNK